MIDMVTNGHHSNIRALAQALCASFLTTLAAPGRTAKGGQSWLAAGILSGHVDAISQVRTYGLGPYLGM